MTYRPAGDRAAESASGAGGLAFDDMPDPNDVSASRRSYSPAQRLVAGVIGRAISDLSITTGVEVRDASGARDWIFGEDLGGDGWSFVAACEFVGLDVEAVRRLATDANGLRVRRAHVYSGSSTTPRPTPPRAARAADYDQIAAGDDAAA